MSTQHSTALHSIAQKGPGATNRGPHHRSQHDRAHTRYLELRRRALLAELRRVNAELRAKRPARVYEDGDCLAEGCCRGLLQQHA